MAHDNRSIHIDHDPDAGLRQRIAHEAANAYAEWRATADEVDTAYRRWADGPVARREPADAYQAALDHEADAAARYAAWIRGLENWAPLSRRRRGA
jgi:hypothetical protein